jgi:hypothetical protein
MPGQKRLAGALAVVAAAMAISACGSSGDNQTIPRSDADALLSELNGVQAAVNKRNCSLAKRRAQAFIDNVNLLPDTVGTANKEALRNAGENLEKLANDRSQCKPERPQAGTTGLSGSQTSSIPAPATTPTTTTSSTTTTTTTSTTQQPPQTGGGNGGGSSSGGGGGSNSGGGGGNTGGGGGQAGGGSGGTGGTGTGGTGGGRGTG